MTVQERVERFLRRNRAKAYCDECIADNLYLPSSTQAQKATSALSRTGPFLRNKDRCSQCRKVKKVTYAL